MAREASKHSISLASLGPLSLAVHLIFDLSVSFPPSLPGLWLLELLGSALALAPRAFIQQVAVKPPPHLEPPRPPTCLFWTTLCALGLYTQLPANTPILGSCRHFGISS